MTSTRIFLLFILLLVGMQAQNCPQLCLNCTAAGCNSCANSFSMTANVSSSCVCPTSTYLDTNFTICAPCPVTCSSCLNYQKCSKCIDGFTLSNSFTCIPLAITETGWTNKNVSYELNPTTMIARNLNIQVGLSDYILTDVLTSSKNCSKLPSLQWLGGQGVFGYNAKLIKSIYGLSPHQWVQIRFQVVLIDKWNGNSLIVQDLSQQLFPNNILTNTSNYTNGSTISNGSKILWSDSFSSANRFRDFCGDNTIPDNLAIVDITSPHQVSALRIRIRMNDSQTPYNINSTLNNAFFGIRQLFIRVGTCGRYCLACKNPNTCFRCLPPYSLVSGICVCNSTLGFNTGSGCQLNCPPGYYLNSTIPSCKSCEYITDNCQLCDSQACLTCEIGFFNLKINQSSTCVSSCPIGFSQTRLMNRTSINQNDFCSPCIANCARCPDQICVLCVSGYLFNGNECKPSCPTGSFPSQGYCITCNPTCSSCSGINICVSCIPGFGLSNDGKCLRLCANSSIVVTSLGCGINCSSPCASCYGPSLNQCLSCSGSLLLEGSKCVSTCSIGLFKNNMTCQPCPQGCLTCISAQTCNTCTTSFYFTLNKCLRMCPISTFPTLDNVNISICSPCPSGCLRCSKNLCLNCQQGLVLFNSSCLISVPQGFYYNKQFQHFKACQSNCLICNGLECSRCNSNFYLEKGVCVISCPSNKYPFVTKASDNSTFNSCRWKRPTCDQYDGFNNSCTRCSIFETKLYLQGGKCIYNCPQLSTISTNASCSSCPLNCKKCISNQCIECISSHVISPDLASCIPNYCPQEYFTDSLQCIPCVTGCSVCQIDGRCLRCLAVFTLNSNLGICISSNCTQLSFSNNAAGVCQSCMSPCRTCLNQATICTSCDPISSLSILYQSTCVSKCPNGYFTHSESKSCRKCNPKCSQCSNLRNCQKCIDGYSLLSFYNPNQAECVAQCPIGFWSDLQKCQSCFKDCKSCWGPSQYQCLTCYPNFALDEFKCVWQCSAGKYRSAYGYCQWCEPGCNRCNGPTLQNCISCSTNQYLSDYACYNENCPGATYLAYPQDRICQQCQFGCSLCTSPHFCRFCFPGYYLYQGWCYKQCPGNASPKITRFWNLQGSYKGIQGYICSQCQTLYTDKCLQCTKDSCISCKAGFYLYRQGQKFDNTLIEQCLTTCPTGTYLRNDDQPECIACSSGCTNCTSYSSCTKCSTGLNLINGYCSSGCPSGNYLNSYQSCTVCPTNCASCMNAITCTSCAPNFFLFFNSSSGNTFCLSNCSTTFYPDASGWCQKCLPTCASCISSSTCSSCLSGFTLSSTGICTNSSTNCPTNCDSCSGQNCLRCNSPYLLITLSTTATATSSCVLNCPIGYYPNIFTCDRCTSGCTTCVNKEENCTSCTTGLYLLNQKCITNCPVGYYASVTSLACQPCSQYCLNCQNNNCMICQSGYYLSSGSCYSTCPIGTYLSSTNLQCYSCPSQCSSCTADQNCTSCSSGYLLLGGICVKNCPQTAYLEQNKCILCSAPCLACTSNTKCLTCLPGLILNGTDCQSQCQAGSFKYSFKVNYTSQIENLDLSTLTSCISCDPSCATCRDSSKNCQSCIQPYILYGSSCLDSCPSTTYLSNGVCRPCSPFCAVCIDFNQCLACVNTTTLFANQCYSACPPGFQMSSQVSSSINSYVCQQCSPACLTCRGSSSYDCLSCNTGYFWLNSSSCVSTCPLGFYSNYNSQACLPCPYGCASCISPNNCTTCISNFILSSTRICQSNSSTCNASNCLNCLSSSLLKCGQCNVGFYLYDGNCFSSCPTSTYTNYGKCIPCSIGCVGCTQQKCLICNSSLILYQGICISDCPYGTLKINNTCTNDLCQFKNPSGDCQACISPYFLYNSSNDDDNEQDDSDDEQDDIKNVVCVLACPNGTYVSGGACIKCSSKCLTCISASQCIQCKRQSFLYNGKCYEDCPFGTYTSSTSCKNCTLSYCQKCQQQNGVEVCDQCKQGAYLYNSNCVIVCPTGTYASSSSQYCKNCPQNCVVCLGSDSCTSCKNGTVLYKGKCISNCPTGTYLSSNTCKQCPTGCSQCQSNSNCFNCLPNFILFTSSSNSSSCVNSCPSGFFAQSSPSTTFSNSYQQKCIQCISPCLTCTTSTSCTNCPRGYSLMQSECLSSCPIGYFSTSYQIITVGGQNIETSRCVPCSPICLSCSGVSNNCSSCPSGYILASSTCVSNCSDNGLYYNSATRDCNKCSVTCYSCSGPTTSNCLSCAAPLQLYAGSCLSTCPFGYYPTPTQICQPCGPTCASCSGSPFNCSLCSSPLFLQTFNNIGSCVQSCSVGYYISNGYCQPCNSKCLTCSGPNENQCLSCKSGLFLVSQTCIQSCPSRTTAIITTAQYSCVPCSANCNSCFYQSSLQTTQCSQCATGYYLSNGVCTLACPIGTFPSPVTYNCDNCNIAGCIKCLLSSTFSLSCTQCQAGQYLYNSICLTSCPNDTILSGSQCVPKPVCTMYEWNGYCLNECPVSTYLTSISTVINGVVVMSLSCKNCSIYCQQCSSETNCVVCTSGTFLMPRSNPNNGSYQCVTICASGYYQISGNCIFCPSPCATCQLVNTGISCLTCPAGFLLMGSQCVSSCPNGYFSNNGLCNLCSPICASCSGLASNCTVCKNINSYTPFCNTSAINCTSIQYLSSASTCSNCHSSCLTCFGGSNFQCSSCNSTLVLILGSCIANCPSGTIRSGTICINCPSNCLNCSLIGTSAICNFCAMPFILVPSTGTCISDCSNLNTPNSSFLLINGNCSPCNITGCLSCILSNGSPSCLACKNGSILYNQLCYSTCPSGTVANYDIGSCVPCSSNCANCSTSGCITCSAGFYILNGQCVSNCGTGYFIANSTCNKCTIINCLNCTATSCTNCQQPYTLTSGQCSSCISGFYLQGGICKACSTSCATCIGSSTSCTTCKLGFYFYNSTCVANCPSGFYISTTGLCMNCTVSNCKECTSNGCSVCQAGFVSVITNGVISCLTACPSASYIDSSSNTCYNCSNGCLRCISVTSCYNCNSPYVLQQGYCLSQCPSGFYNSNGTCQSCPTTCKTCISATNCTTCSAGFSNSNGNCVLPPSNCSTGYFRNVLGNCDQCFTSCKSCQGQSSSDCLSCFSGYNLTNGVCIQNCNSTSFYNTATSNCQSCLSLTANCLSCNSTNCLVCNTNYTVLSGKCTQVCPTGTFLNNNNCLPCSSYCISCSSGSVCSKCLNSSFIIVNGQCVSECPDQTYLKNGQCVSCYQTCLTCSGSSTNCSSCLSPYYLYLSSCVSSCPNGTYEDSSFTCQNCSSNCKLCSSATKCDQCIPDFYLINGTCRSNCPNGYYIDTATNRCIECLYPCLSCTARNKCSSCASPSILSNSMCINSNCTGGYYDFSLNACQNCSVNNCGYCTNSSCSYCKNGYYSVYSSSIITYCQTNCPDGTYKDNATYNCSSCFTNCKTCQNDTWCNTCLPNYFLLSVERSSVNECVDTCPQGYYANSSTCKPCLSNCISCPNSQNCITCKPDYFLLTIGNSSKCVQNCPTAYFTPSDLTGNGQCGSCSSNCLSCLDIATCLQCESGYRVFNGICVPSNCVNCQVCNYTSNICITCDYGYFILDNSCVKTCPDFYFGSNLTGKCEKCIENCLVCGDTTSCYICITGYEFVNGTGCQNSGYLNFGALGNMSGFTSNITQIMAMVYVTTSTGPIAFGALSSTYGLMQLCQVLYIMQGTTGDNQEMNTFLNSLSATSYTSNSGTDNTDTNSSSTSSISSKRLLTAVDYTSNFFQTNLPIFLMMIAFVSAYVLVLIFEKYQNSCCLSCPNLLRYISYTCQFMKMRFKYIYVDTVMWISYLPFLYFSILQLKKGDFSAGASVFSSLLAIIIIIVYPLYPLFILRKLFDRSEDPEENLKNYKSITLLEPQIQADKSMCADFSCCPKKDKLTYQQMVQKNKLAMVQMSLSPYIEKVKRPVYNENMDGYNEFKYFKKQHWILAYAAVKYFRKFLIALVVAICSDPSLTLGIVAILIVGYMAYLIALKPKQKLYLVLEIILESVLLIFILMMLIYVSIGGATVTAMSVVTHAVGFVIANSSLFIAIILNIMSYYTIFCCIYDLIQHLKNKVVEEEQKEKNFNQMLEEKDKIHNDDDIKDKDKDGMEIKVPRRGDDEQTEENNDEQQNYENFELDQKQFALKSMIKKKNTFGDDEDQDFTNLKSTKGGRREKRKQERKKSRHLDEQTHTSEEIMAHSKLSNQQLHDVEDGLLKQRDNKFRRDVNNKDINVIKGQIRDPTDKFKRHSKKIPHQQQQSMDTLTIPHGKQEILIDMRTQDRLTENPRLIEREKNKKNDQAEIDNVNMRQREKNKKGLNEANLYERQGKPKKQGENEADLPEGKFIDKNNSKKGQFFGDFEEQLANQEEAIKNAQLKQRQAKKNRQTKKKESEQIMDIDMIDRVQKAKKQQNKHYKGSDEQVNIEEGQARQVKNRFRKEGKRKIPNPSEQPQININAYGKDITTKKAQKVISNREFAEDNQDQLTYKERQGKNISKGKEANNNIRPEDTLNEAEAYNRQKRVAEKKQKVQQIIPQQNLLSVGFKEVEKRKSSKQKPSIYDNLDKDLTQSIQFGDNSKPQVKKRAKRQQQQEHFEESQMSKVGAQKIGKNKSGNGRLDISQNLEESYEDTIKKNKQQMFKQTQQNKSRLMDLSEDPFQQLEYQRPESKMQRPSSRNKDLGLGVNSRQGSEASDDQSRDVRKRKNSAMQRIRKRGQLNVNENDEKDNQDNVGSDSRRISRVARPKSKLKGVLNIDDRSQNEDIEEMRL